jgi:hypothetical protein
MGKIARWLPGTSHSKAVPRELTGAVGQNSDFQNGSRTWLDLFYGQMGEASCIRVPPQFISICLCSDICERRRVYPPPYAFIQSPAINAERTKSMNEASLLGD